MPTRPWPTPGTAVAYVRLATRDARFKEQQQRCHQIAAALGLNVSRTYADIYEPEGSTGRPGLRQLLEHVRRRPVAHVIVASPDQLSPSLEELLDIEMEIWRCGATVIDGLDIPPHGAEPSRLARQRRGGEDV